ncbi:MAG TPA: ABC transporter substrate-binding protein [Longimicrobium sp.]|nr:ABC transporter substrate-binding protein [Longimicrobium sp.]
MSRKSFRAMFLLALVFTSACGRGSDDFVYLGVAGPLSAANGASMRMAAEMAVEEINKDGGIGGRQVRLLMMDDKADAQVALTIADSLRRDPRVVAVVGHLNSGPSLKAATIYNAPEGEHPGQPLMHISPASSAPAFTQAGPWSFRVTPTDLEFAPVLARGATELGRRRVAVLYANDDYGQGVMTTFERAFRAGGGSVVSADPYLPAVVENGTELDPYLSRAIRRGADALVIGGQAETGLKIVLAARRLGFTGPILGSDGLTGLKDAGAPAEGVFISSAFLPDRGTDLARQFVQRYRARNNNALPDHRGAMTYDVINLLRRAINEVGTDREKVRDYVAQIGAKGGSAPFEGVSGTIVFDQNGDVVGKEVSLGVVRGGQLVTAARR